MGAEKSVRERWEGVRKTERKCRDRRREGGAESERLRRVGKEREGMEQD